MKSEKCDIEISEYENFYEKYLLHLIINHGDTLTDEWLEKNKDWHLWEKAEA